MIVAVICLLIGTVAASVTVDVGAAAVDGVWRPTSCDDVKGGVVLTNIAANVRAVIEGCTITVSSPAVAAVSAVTIDGLGADASVELRSCTITATFTHTNVAIHAAVHVLPGAALGAGSALVIDGTSVEIYDHTRGTVAAAVLFDTAVIAGDRFTLLVKGGSKLRAECTDYHPCGGIAVIGDDDESATDRIVFGAHTTFAVKDSVVHANSQKDYVRAVWVFGATFGNHSVVAVSNSVLDGAAVGRVGSGLDVKAVEFGGHSTVSVTASNVSATASPFASSGVIFYNVGFGDDAFVLIDGCNITAMTASSCHAIVLNSPLLGLRANVSVRDSVLTAFTSGSSVAAVWFDRPSFGDGAIVDIQDSQINVTAARNVRGVYMERSTFGHSAAVTLRSTRISTYASSTSHGVFIGGTFGNRSSLVLSGCIVGVTHDSNGDSAGVRLERVSFGALSQFELAGSDIVLMNASWRVAAFGLDLGGVKFGEESDFKVIDSSVSASRTAVVIRLSLGVRSRFLFARSTVTAVAVSMPDASATALHVSGKFLETAVTFRDSRISVTGGHVHSLEIGAAELHDAVLVVERCNVSATSWPGGTFSRSVITWRLEMNSNSVVSFTGCNIAITGLKRASALEFDRLTGESNNQLVLEDTHITATATATVRPRGFLCYGSKLGARAHLRITRCNMTTTATTDDATVLEIDGEQTFGADSLVSVENTSLTAKAGGAGSAAIQIKDNVMTGNGSLRIVGSTLTSFAVSSAQALRFDSSDLTNTSIVVVGSVLQFGATAGTSTDTEAPAGAITSDQASTWDNVSLTLTDTSLAASDATTAAAKATFIVWPKTVTGVSPQHFTNVSLTAPEAAAVAVFAVTVGGAGPGPNATLCLRDVVWGHDGYGVRAGPAAFAIADECIVTPTSSVTVVASRSLDAGTPTGSVTSTNALTATLGATKSSGPSESASVLPTVSALGTLSLAPSPSRPISGSRTVVSTETVTVGRSVSHHRTRTLLASETFSLSQQLTGTLRLSGTRSASLSHQQTQSTPSSRTRSSSVSHHRTHTASRSVPVPPTAEPPTSGLSTAETALLATGLSAFGGVSVGASLFLLWRFRHLLPRGNVDAGPATELKQIKAVDQEGGEQWSQENSDDEGCVRTAPNPFDFS